LNLPLIKTLFILRINISETYSRAKYMYISFSSKEEYKKELNRIFLYKGKVIQIVKEKIPTCHQCSSKLEIAKKYKRCKEKSIEILDYNQFAID
jgi:hypothetical protein